jgi:hypothetical protein
MTFRAYLSKRSRETVGGRACLPPVRRNDA